MNLINAKMIRDYDDNTVSIVSMWSFIVRNLGDGIIKKTTVRRLVRGIETDCIEFVKHYEIVDIIHLLEEYKNKIPRYENTRSKWLEFMQRINKEIK